MDIGGRLRGGSGDFDRKLLGALGCSGEHVCGGLELVECRRHRLNNTANGCFKGVRTFEHLGTASSSNNLRCWRRMTEYWLTAHSLRCILAVTHP